MVITTFDCVLVTKSNFSFWPLQHLQRGYKVEILLFRVLYFINFQRAICTVSYAKLQTMATSGNTGDPPWMSSLTGPMAEVAQMAEVLSSYCKENIALHDPRRERKQLPSQLWDNKENPRICAYVPADDQMYEK